ncbi:endoplasmic reticulum protein [Lentinula aff. detonsa]|uniref:Endoplasmic reticulum protein n=1 Tax=Lentinula aff. detonsa TaxID=2804958 RepID=A0AA38NSH7_9AGAR|nr:endoplasmic reticulum protein [Lentinula aff. detonsa]KAJ3794036.1 endoplasmic reticulum protein [Lentinula aff. detonsa]
MSMLRVSTMRAFRGAPVNGLRIAAPGIQVVQSPHIVRFNSTEPKPKPRPVPKEKDFNPVRDWDAKVIRYDELKPKTKSPAPNSWLIDVREPDEVMQGMIPSAVNIPLTILPESLNASPATFREKFGFEKPERNQEVTFYCRSGKRSSSASDIAKRNGYTHILNYEGSWLDWVEREAKAQGKSS